MLWCYTAGYRNFGISPHLPPGKQMSHPKFSFNFFQKQSKFGKIPNNLLQKNNEVPGILVFTKLQTLMLQTDVVHFASVHPSVQSCCWFSSSFLVCREGHQLSITAWRCIRRWIICIRRYTCMKSFASLRYRTTIMETLLGGGMDNSCCSLATEEIDPLINIIPTLDICVCFVGANLFWCMVYLLVFLGCEFFLFHNMSNNKTITKKLHY